MANIAFNLKKKAKYGKQIFTRRKKCLELETMQLIFQRPISSMVEPSLSPIIMGK